MSSIGRSVGALTGSVVTDSSISVGVVSVGDSVGSSLWLWEAESMCSGGFSGSFEVDVSAELSAVLLSCGVECGRQL